MAGTRAKDRKRQKRKEKHVQKRRALSGSPYQRVQRLGGEVTCSINRGWRDEGMASLFCVRTAPGGGYALASFLIDIWCIGLKDAWGRLDLTSEEVAELRNNAKRNGVKLVSIDADAARRLVAGGIRFARQNGFRLPKHYHRWVSLLGDIGDERAADLSDFGRDGGLYYVGPVEGLRQRLIGSTLEAFLARKDVKYILGPSLWDSSGDEFEDDDAVAGDDDDEDSDDLLDDEEDDDDEALEVDAEILKEAAAAVSLAMVAGVRRWCFANGIVPHHRLAEAWDLMSAVAFERRGFFIDEHGDDDLETLHTRDLLGEKLDALPPAIGAEIMAAVSQIQSFISTFDNAQQFDDYMAHEISQY